MPLPVAGDPEPGTTLLLPVRRRLQQPGQQVQHQQERAPVGQGLQLLQAGQHHPGLDRAGQQAGQLMMAV